MNDEQFRKRGLKPLACIMHAEKTHGAIGRIICKKTRKRGGPSYYVASLFEIKGKLAYGDPLPITAKEAHESQKVAFLLPP